MGQCFLPFSPHCMSLMKLCPPFIVYLLMYMLHHIGLYRICFVIVSFKNRIHLKMIKVIYGHDESKCSKGCIMRGSSSCPTHNHLSSPPHRGIHFELFLSFLCIIIVIYWFINFRYYLFFYYDHLLLTLYFYSFLPSFKSSFVREIVFTLL